MKKNTEVDLINEAYASDAYEPVKDAEKREAEFESALFDMHEPIPSTPDVKEEKKTKSKTTKSKTSKAMSKPKKIVLHIIMRDDNGHTGVDKVFQSVAKAKEYVKESFLKQMKKVYETHDTTLEYVSMTDYGYNIQIKYKFTGITDSVDVYTISRELE